MHIVLRIVSGALLLIAGQASAAIVLDQSDIPTTGAIATKNEGGTPLNVATPLGQSFSVGKTGTLAEIDIALITVDPLINAAPIQFDVRNTSNQVLFSTTIPASAIPVANLQGQTWDVIPRIDVSAANLQVTAGEELWFTVTPNQSPAILLFQTDNTPFQYLTGELFNFTTGGTPVFGSTGDYGFRTFVNVADAPPPVIIPPGGQPGDNSSVSAVPEPATWAMILLGFFLVGLWLRRRPAQRVTVLPALA